MLLVVDSLALRLLQFNFSYLRLRKKRSVGAFVPTAPFSTHTLLNLHDIQILTILIACILAPSIRVMQYTGCWFLFQKAICSALTHNDVRI